ncbi:cell division protein DivIC [Virgibacillus halotolerans]|uniref:FtsB family cell division protein n=1 Tax=Virgibacillus halotolerans TaxID=1071053 RepID=UPI0019621CEB|nr:septum formation initiator family protein [Virgibacillus halotolerans]MBM7601287.1 cell division protein DivIC [Virgibacillus halotolerans]
MTSKEKTVTRLDSNYMQQYDAYIGRQKRKRKRLMRRLVLFSVVAMIVIGSMATYHIKQRVLQADKAEQYEQLEKDLTSLKKQEDDMNEEIELLKDEDYVLEIARTNYFFSKKGEMIFKLPNEDPAY